VNVKALQTALNQLLTILHANSENLKYLPDSQFGWCSAHRPAQVQV
jgi:hypothetical protein